MNGRVLIVGYSSEIAGGVTTVISLLRQQIPYLDLHVAVRYYHPRWKVLAFTAYSLAVYAVRLLVNAPRVVQVIVGSRGDAIRMLPFILLGKARGCKVCLHFHKNASAILDDFRPAVRRMILSVWGRADGYCFLSKRLRDEFAGKLDSRKPHVVIPNPISDGWLQQIVLPRTQRTRGAIFLGRWSPEKGVGELVSAIGSFGPDSPLQCDVYSDYRPSEAMQNLVFHDWLCEDKVRQVLRETTLLLLPSHAEAFPMVLLEAAACGTPFVAARIAGVQDIAEESRAGLLHEVGDVDGMHNAIGRLLADDALWSQCAHDGRHWVESLEASRVVPEWRRFYADLGVKLA
jgi:glycosyltransferase involved in cell wall biosynthesis